MSKATPPSPDAVNKLLLDEDDNTLDEGLSAANAVPRGPTPASLAAAHAALAAREAELAAREAALAQAAVVHNPASAGPDVPNNAKPIGMPETLTIVLEEGDNMAPTGQMVSLNGRAYLIRPGEEVTVPLGIVEILDNATMMVPDRNGSQQVTGWRNRQRFPYRVLRRHAA